MTIHTEIVPPAPAADPETPSPTPPDPLAVFGYAGVPSQRYEGWIGKRQRVFLQALSEGSSVDHACRIVGLSRQSAYAFRRSARGAGFALGGDAALLLACEVLADNLMGRALDGVTDTYTYRNGETATRHRHDNRLAMAMLTRMDRMADAARAGAANGAVRLVAQDFEQYLEIVGRDSGPARAGLFVAARAEAAAADDLAPIRALARADRWLRTHTDLAAPLDTAGLDPAQRGEWTAEQWARAEEAGLVRLAEPAAEAGDPAGGNRQPCQHLKDSDNPEEPPVWMSDTDQWRTTFPPPDGFDGEEDGEYGDECYSRTLTADEEIAADAPRRAEIEARRIVEEAERDAWFGFVPAAAPPPAREASAAAAADDDGDDDDDADDDDWGRGEDENWDYSRDDEPLGPDADEDG